MSAPNVRTVLGAICVIAVGAITLSGMVNRTLAHCDTMNGPVIPEARAALEKGDVTPVLKWVREGDQEEIRAAFARAVAVRVKGEEARELADRYFLETLIRVHRAGEGAPYTGLKDEPVEPIVAMADRALADGSADEMVRTMTSHMAKAIQEKFDRAAAARRNKDRSVEEGRAYVDAYVTYVHYVEGIHAAMQAVPGHSEAAGKSDAEAGAQGGHEH